MREIHHGVVSRVNDPQKLGRIRVKCQTLASSETELPFWIKPSFPFSSKGSAGWFSVPEVGSNVELEVNVSSGDDETLGETFISAPDVRYRAAFYTPTNPPDDVFKTNYPNRRGMVTPGGHMIIFDDKEGQESITLQHKDGHSIVLDHDGIVKLGGIDVTDKVAMAQKVQDELNALRTALHNHKHTVALGLCTAGGATGVTDTSTAPSIPAINPVGSEIVKLK